MRVNMGTKRAGELIYDFNHKYYKGDTIYDVYKSVSSKKASSWRAIENTCKELNGWNLHITGASCNNYSCMYAFQYIDPDTAEVFVVLRKETKGNTYDLYMTPDEYSENCA